MQPTVFGRLVLAGKLPEIEDGLAHVPRGLDTLRQPAVTPAARQLVDAGLLELDEPREPALPRSGRFGELMIVMHGLRRQDLERCLALQQQYARRGRYMWLGEIFVDQNLVTPAQVQRVLARQKRGVEQIQADPLGPAPQTPCSAPLILRNHVT